MKITIPLSQTHIDALNDNAVNEHFADDRGTDKWSQHKSLRERWVQMLSVLSATRLRFNIVSRDNILWTLHDLRHPDPENYVNDIMDFIKRKRYTTYT